MPRQGRGELRGQPARAFRQKTAPSGADAVVFATTGQWGLSAQFPAPLKT
ncbi:hypothetical protein SAMN05216251_105242 [Actinacidiphila alni]|uniref:Uncharacterized protein n=1 Tax=Actinacidiphila alni TaxID=380248 RepID=A0A1I2DHA1_9ACTN|nr:hypothetical protein SAMN05216251_105242 [Actinacidiphila alni]